jgi:ATP-binding cassette subfamily F protein uup
MIASLMLSPANVLVLDEPTNDLDLRTLDVLEEALKAFDGAVLLVTHDRYFLDNVTTELIAFHTRSGEEGRITKMVGLEQWELWHATQTAPADPPPSRNAAPASVNAPAASAAAAPRKKKKLSFNEQRDFDTVEARILEAESKLAALTEESGRPDVVSNHTRLVALTTEMAAARAEVDRLYARWAELEALLNG